MLLSAPFLLFFSRTSRAFFVAAPPTLNYSRLQVAKGTLLVKEGMLSARV